MSSSPQAVPADSSLEISLGEGRTVRASQVIGRGSCATVYRGVLTGPHKFRRVVALKVFDAVATDLRENAGDAIARTVRKAACVHHPNVVAPIEFAMVELTPIVISEFVDGGSLENLHEAYARLDRKMPTDLALFIALEVAEGLAGARDARTPEGAVLNMRHHDLSPREVLISWHGEVKISDFGVRAATQNGSGVTSLNVIARRCATMAPEVVAGSRGDARSDVFSLGMLLRQLLVGPRFAEGTPDRERLEMARVGAIHIGLMESPIWGPVGEILQRALAVEPMDRYPDAGRFAFDLRRACLSMGVGDGRVFLRSAMRDLLSSRLPADPTRPEPRREKADSGEVLSIPGGVEEPDRCAG